MEFNLNTGNYTGTKIKTGHKIFQRKLKKIQTSYCSTSPSLNINKYIYIYIKKPMECPLSLNELLH